MSGYIGTKAVTLSTTSANVGGSSTVGAGLTVDNDGATVLTVDRATSDGTIIDVQKGGTSVGGIGVSASDDFYIGASTASHAGVYFGTDIVYPMRANSLSDGVTSIGHSSNRFNNLYLSGGVYLGGTGAANKLDDYEEGTWTPFWGGDSSNPTVTYNVQNGDYTKVGRIVHVRCHLEITGTASGGGGGLYIGGLPFTSANDGYVAGTVSYRANFTTNQAPTHCLVNPNTTKLPVYYTSTSDPRNSSSRAQTAALNTNCQIYLAASYNV